MFKVGDKVKIINNNSYIHHYFRIGEIGTVVKVNNRTLNVQGRIFQEVLIEDVELCIPSPVRETTVVKKEIVPGNYGKVYISDNKWVGMSSTPNKQDIAEAIKTLQTIHDAME